MIHTKITGLGHYLPGEVVTNDNLVEMFGPEIELLCDQLKVTGRYWVSDYKSGKFIEDPTGSSLGAKAALEALNYAKMDKNDIDLIISITSVPECELPETSILIQKRMGIKSCAALDIRAGCSGTIQAIHIANQFISTGIYKNCLIIGTECLSPIYYKWFLEQRDSRKKMTELTHVVAFSDGAGALILSGSDCCDESDILFSNMRSEFPDLESGLVIKPVLRFNEYGKIKRMKDILSHSYKLISKYLPMTTKAALNSFKSSTSITEDEIDFIIAPQADPRFYSHVSKIMGENSNVYTNGGKIGNSLSASLTIALHDLATGNRLKKGDLILLIGVESPHWQYSTALIKWSNQINSEVLP